MTVRKGQVWLYRRTDGVPPVVHVVTKADGEVCESTSVFTEDGLPNERTVLSGAGCGGIGIRRMEAGKDKVGTWALLYDPPHAEIGSPCP